MEKPHDKTKSKGSEKGSKQGTESRALRETENGVKQGPGGNEKGGDLLLQTGQQAAGPTCHKGVKGKLDNIIPNLQLKKPRHKVLRPVSGHTAKNCVQGK